MLVEKTVLRRLEFVLTDGEVNPAAHAEYERQMIDSDTGDVRGVMAHHRETFDLTGNEAEKVQAIMGDALSSAIAVHEAHARMHAETVARMDAEHKAAIEQKDAEHKAAQDALQAQFDEYRRQASGMIAAQQQELQGHLNRNMAIIQALQQPAVQPQPTPADDPPAA